MICGIYVGYKSKSFDPDVYLHYFLEFVLRGSVSDSIIFQVIDKYLHIMSCDAIAMELQREKMLQSY